MDLYNVCDLPLSNDLEIRKIQEKQLNGEELTMQEKIRMACKSKGGRDHTIRKIGDYECKLNHCYRCISFDTLKIYQHKGFIIDERKEEYVNGENNAGIDWYLGGACPNRYGYIIIECPAYKDYFTLTSNSCYGMSLDINVRHVKSSPSKKPIPFSLITNIFDYKKIMQEQRLILNMAKEKTTNERECILEEIQNSNSRNR